jgi:hypothetical protein
MFYASLKRLFVATTAPQLPLDAGPMLTGCR